MGIDSEIASGGGFLKDVIETGWATLAQAREFDLVKYNAFRNPADGYLYWLKTDEVQKITGSLHNRAIQENTQDHTNNRNTIILTTSDQIKGFDVADPTTALFISIQIDDPSIVDGGPMIIGFNSSDAFYEQAGTYHYMGEAVFPNFRQFIVDDPVDWAANIVPANSLPIMIDQLGDYGVPVYAAWAVPANIQGAYISVNIDNSRTMHMMPLYDSAQGVNYANQFKADDIELVAYNMRAANIQGLVTHIFDSSMRPAKFGLMSIPQVNDIPAVQSEYGIRADKKSVKMSINYWLSTSTELVRKTITQANFTMEIE